MDPEVFLRQLTKVGVVHYRSVTTVVISTSNLLTSRRRLTTMSRRKHIESLGVSNCEVEVPSAFLVWADDYHEFSTLSRHFFDFLGLSYRYQEIGDTGNGQYGAVFWLGKEKDKPVELVEEVKQREKQLCEEVLNMRKIEAEEKKKQLENDLLNYFKNKMSDNRTQED